MALAAGGIDGGGLEPSADSDGTRRPMAASNPHDHTVGGFQVYSNQYNREQPGTTENTSEQENLRSHGDLTVGRLFQVVPGISAVMRASVP